MMEDNLAGRQRLFIKLNPAYIIGYDYYLSHDAIS